jgi:DNA invertase Pin-like site-specific DNA recombinase
VSLEAHEAKIAAHCLVKDWPPVEIIRDEAFSAKSLYRPGLQRLLSLVEGRQVEVLIISKLDRLTRSLEDLNKLIKLFDGKGMAPTSLQVSLDVTTATGRLMMNLLASVSRWEREVIGERTREALQHLKAQGKRYCYATFEQHPDASRHCGRRGGTIMTDKATLHQLIEDLPESELVAAARFLAYLRDTADPVRCALLTAP